MSSKQNSLRRTGTAAENFLYSDNEKSDYNWLVTPPASPSKSVTNQPDANPMTLKSRLENYKISSENQTTSLHDSTSYSRIRRPSSSSSSSSRSTSRPSTPIRRSTTPAKRTSTPASRATSTVARATFTLSSTSSSRSTSRPSSSSGTSRVTLTAARATRPTTSTGRYTTGSTNNRPMSAPNSKPGSRSSTPTRRPSTPTGSSTVLRSKQTKPVNKPTHSQGASPVARSRPWEPYEMPGFSLEAPSNLRTMLPVRPQTASSSRTRAFGASSSSRLASIEREVARRQSCSPSRSRAPIGNVNGDVPSLRGRRAKTNSDDGDLISHVAKGSQKIERVVNTRKLAPVPRLTESCGRGRGGGGGSSAGRSSSKSNNGSEFGRNLSKSSIDMVLRHMDIRGGSMAGNFRPLVTKVPETSLYNVRSGRNRPVSSRGSSESSVNVLCVDSSDDNLSDRSYV